MKEKYVRTDEILSEVSGDNLAAMDAFMEIFGYKRVKAMPTQEKCPIIPTNIDYYEGRIARRMHWDATEKTKFFGNMLIINQNAYISMLLKEVARKMYGEECLQVKSPNQGVFVVSLDNFSIGELPYGGFCNPRHMALFNSEKDAQLAVNIVKQKFEIHE